MAHLPVKLMVMDNRPDLLGLVGTFINGLGFLIVCGGTLVGAGGGGKFLRLAGKL